MTVPPPVDSPSVGLNPLAVRLLLSMALVACLYATLIGSGLLGTSVVDAARGSLRPDATLIAPSVGAFRIWMVIYLGLTVLTLWQWIPAGSSTDRVRFFAWPLSLSMWLNAGWLAMVQLSAVWASALVMVALEIVLIRLLIVSRRFPAPTRASAILTDGTIQLYTGWVTFALPANIASALVFSGVPATGAIAVVAAVSVLAAVAVLGWMMAGAFRGAWGIPLAMIWGLAWLADARTSAVNSSALVAWSAAGCALILAGSFVCRSWPAPLPRRALVPG